MEIKKSKTADLESKRVTWFLLGLILVLSVCFVALEYTDHGESLEDADEALLESMADDADLIPMMMQNSMLSMVPEEKPAVTERLRIVDSTGEKPEDDVADARPDIPIGAFVPGPEAGAGAEDIAAELPPVATDMDNNPLNFHVVEELPQFPGGIAGFMKWITRNLRYPLAAERQKIEGKVVVQFVVEKDGSVSGLKVVGPLHPYCDREAMRVLRMMPRWKPGTQHDKPCRTMVCIPIVFKL